MVQLRQAFSEDAPVIQAIAVKTWWPTYTPILEAEQIRYMLNHIYDVDTIRGQIANGEQRYLLLTDDNEPKGFAAFSLRKESPEIYKLHKLYCLPETKGKGFGKLLLDKVERLVEEDGCNIVDLNVNKYNPAKGFYEKMGYSVIYEEDIPIGPYWMNDYVMRKLL